MVLPLTDDELKRYQRHILLKEVGGAGQQRLKGARVAVIGAGGLGSPLLLYLAAAGVGALRIVDDDKVALSNLQRQVLYTVEDLGRPKVEAATERLAALNPHVRVEARAVRLAPENAEGLVTGCDLVCDGSDNFLTRAAVSDACVRAGITLVSAAVGRFDGQLAVFKGRPCYRCLYPEPPGEEEVCATQGILGTVTGLLGTMQANAALAELLELGESLAGKLLLVEAAGLHVRMLTLPPDPDCPACGGAARS